MLTDGPSSGVFYFDIHNNCCCVQIIQIMLARIYNIRTNQDLQKREIKLLVRDGKN